LYRGRILAGVLAAAVMGGGAYVVHSRGSTDLEMELTASRIPDAGQEQYLFTISGTPVDGLYPGAVRHIKLTFTNPYGFDLHVTGMHTQLVSASKPGCQPVASNLEIQPYTGTLPVRVPAGGSKATGNVPLHMPNTVANDCQQAVFTIKLTGDAIRTNT
jgi:hypothetical protein